MTRAKFHCTSVETYSTDLTGPRVYRFQPQYDASIPEDQRYARYTPSGELRITVDNPAVSFEPGRAYYLDFTPADSVERTSSSQGAPQ
ncbi:hypothetical protein [Sphaerisporangium sp. NPDC051011]|uniref:hypothetical protein n=1 Tax=Sphaerisporangium sp. NPDC051011 TaxID=3155792 RepID=UPI0033F85E1C